MLCWVCFSRHCSYTAHSLMTSLDLRIFQTLVILTWNLQCSFLVMFTCWLPWMWFWMLFGSSCSRVSEISLPPGHLSVNSGDNADIRRHSSPRSADSSIHADHSRSLPQSARRSSPVINSILLFYHWCHNGTRGWVLNFLFARSQYQGQLHVLRSSNLSPVKLMNSGLYSGWGTKVTASLSDPPNKTFWLNI